MKKYWHCDDNKFVVDHETHLKYDTQFQEYVNVDYRKDKTTTGSTYILVFTITRIMKILCFFMNQC